MPNLKLFKLTQTKNRGYDTYDSFVVCAYDKKTARHYNPETGLFDLPDEDENRGEWYGAPTWCGAKDVKVEFLGISEKFVKEGLVLGSFNAG